MTSETETLKTNEFLRRRKLRLQQVREQSKDIAKKIRQRAKVESLRQVVDLDAKKQKEYFDRQEKLVQQLEVLYSRGLHNFGASHQSVSEINQQDEITKADLSKLRGKEATAELRKKRQEKLDQQKKILDRRLHAREAANELSREKSTIVTNKLLQKQPQGSDDTSKNIPSSSTVVKDINKGVESKDDPEIVTKNDMATQWDIETMPNEWAPTVPILKLPNDDMDKGDEQLDSKTDKTKRKDLFALSEGMPSDLRGGHMEIPETRCTIRPSLTLVSEYLQSRNLRLRTVEAPKKKKVFDDMSSLKQTIQRSRTTNAEVGGKGSTCTDNSKPEVLNRKNSVLMYNHNTRDIRDLPRSDEQLVVRDLQGSEDAYSQAMKESEGIASVQEKASQKKVQDMRNKVAVTKQTVEKEYKDTINFLNSLPKDGSKINKVAYMDERRQKMLKETRQHKMQQEYNKIENDCRRHHHSCLNKSRKKSRSPVKHNEDEFERGDFQYSWMPVPDGDGNLAVHTIPNTVKDGKSGNSVKFSKVDSYHEYRSRHKHTPPTKDTVVQENHSKKKCVKTVIIDKNTGQSSDESSTISNTSSVENLGLINDVKDAQDSKDNNLSDAERIIIYKILDTKHNKHSKRNKKLLSNIAKSLSSLEKVQKSVVDEKSVVEGSCDLDTQHTKKRQPNKTVSNTMSFEQINEGIYKVAEDGDNLASVQLNTNTDSSGIVPVKIQKRQKCHCATQHVPSEVEKREKGVLVHRENDETTQSERTKSCQCNTASKEKGSTSPIIATQKVRSVPAEQLSAVTSTSSFKSATNDKAASALPERGYIKLVDEEGHEAGKFYLGAASFLKDNAYEVVIQLRKKDGSKEEPSKPEIEKELTSNEVITPVNLGSESIATMLSNSQDQEPLQSRTSKKESNANTTSISTAVTHISGDNLTLNTREKAVSNSDITNDHIRLISPTEKKKETSENATNFNQNESPLAQVDPPSRPATSTYTQTINSPINRPVYFHMSSSTSTAYMSPPEMILPKFLRHDYIMTEDEVCGLQDIQTVQEPVKYERSNKTCKHARKSQSDVNIKRVDCKVNTNDTPPNTARSNIQDTDETDFKRPKSGKPCRKAEIVKRKCHCHNCGIHSSKDRVKKQCTTNKNAHFESNPLSLNLSMLLNTNVTSKNKKKPTSLNHNKKGSPNVIIRDYINQLLALNREGLKAIEVADQECSSIGTPGSSIINVPFNVDERKPLIGNKISLEHLKKALFQQIVNENFNSNLRHAQSPVDLYPAAKKCSLPRKPRKKTVHKVKSFNIAKHLLIQKNEEFKRTKQASLSTTTDDNSNIFSSSFASKWRPRSLPLSRQTTSTRPLPTFRQLNTKKSTKTVKKKTIGEPNKLTNIENIPKRVNFPHRKENAQANVKLNAFLSSRYTLTDTSPDSELTKDSHNYYKNKTDMPISMSTQTSQDMISTEIRQNIMSTQTSHNIDSEFVKIAEDKLLNMEKIADLTEKCTTRLSNLAKVLEEVRKNKSLVYSQISASDSTDSHSDQKSDNVAKSPVPNDSIDIPNRLELKSPEPISEKENTTVNEKKSAHVEFISFLSDIPKTVVLPLPRPIETASTPINMVTEVRSSPLPASPVNTDKFTSEIIKCRPKPPPALSRIHLKHSHEHISPHELSTVLEVDSPLSVKNKNQSSRTEVTGTEDKKVAKNDDEHETPKEKEATYNPDLLQTSLEIPRLKLSTLSTESCDNSKFQMIDLKQFNEIMLEPFISIHEYAKKYNVAVPDEGSNIEDIQRDEAINDDMSSLHSDGSLPDVIAELLKRNIITEPFKFDTASNVNSNTFSSESTLSILALSKARKLKRRSNVMFQNKENIGETSDTMSMSSNPDLENAFKKLGMGWASSTLKKTKERLALSSSSNTSSSSLQQVKIKSFNHDIPAVVTDSVSSVPLSKKVPMFKTDDDSSKNAGQQTSFENSTIVKEFLTNELANKITFTSNKSGMNDTEDEFVSLFVTKMPEGMKQQTENRDEQSNDSLPSGAIRARTSTPVQLFKSMTFQSSSSSNISNGLFSNADDLSSVKMTSNSMKNHSTSEKDDLTIPNFSLKMKKGSDSSKSE